MTILQFIFGGIFGGVVGFVGSMYGFSAADWPFWALIVSGGTWSLISSLAAAA